MLCARTLVSDNWTDGPPILYGHTRCGSEVSHGLVWATAVAWTTPPRCRPDPVPACPSERIEFMEKLMAGRSRSPRVAVP